MAKALVPPQEACRVCGGSGGLAESLSIRDMMRTGGHRVLVDGKWQYRSADDREIPLRSIGGPCWDCCGTGRQRASQADDPDITLWIDVTEDDIRKGQENGRAGNPISAAAIRQFPLLAAWQIERIMHFYRHEGFLSFELPAYAVQWLEDYRAGREVQPFGFVAILL